jgi:antitoxin VapB
VTTTRHIKLFRNGRNQAIRIPREFELPGTDAILHREGNRLVIEAAPPSSLLAVLRTLEPISESLPEFVDAAPDAVDL